MTGLDDVAAYLEGAIEEVGNNPALIAQAFAVVARFGNVSEQARRVDLSREGLYKGLSAGGNPSFATLMKVATALGLRVHLGSAVARVPDTES